jgi:predicted MFS family arabinose efflux permease
MARADRFPAGPAHRDFRRLAAALGASQVGDWLYNVALLTVVYERTASPSWVALTTAARIAPIVVLGPLGGVVADRFDRRRVMIVSDAVRVGMMAALALVAAAMLPVVAAPLIAAAATAAGSPYPPAVGATTPRLVAEADLATANALRSAIGAAGIVVGPALGAGLMIVASPSVAILVNAGTFAASALLVASIPASDAFAPARAGATAGVLADLRDGADALRRSRPVVLLVGADIAASAVYGAQTVLLVLLARRLGGHGYGLLIAAIGAGGLLGAAVSGRVASARRSSAVLVGALLVVAAAMALLAASPSLAAAMVLVAACGAGSIVVEILSETGMQRLLDDTVLARAYGLALPAALGGIVLGSLAAAPLQALLGLDGALVACGTGVALYAAVVAVASAAPAPAPAAEPVATVATVS